MGYSVPVGDGVQCTNVGINTNVEISVHVVLVEGVGEKEAGRRCVEEGFGCT